MSEWLKNLEPEFLIIFIGIFIVVVISVVILIKSGKTLSLIGSRALNLNEDLVIRNGKKVVDILVSNTSFISVQVAAVGYIFKKNLLPISEEVTEISPRDSEKISIEIDALRAYVISDSKKVKKMKIYAEDTLGRRTVYRAKNSYRTLKKIVKDENKAIKKAAKIKRFETGKYNFPERVGLVFKFIFSPCAKLNRIIKEGLNKKLREREARLKVKRKEEEHKAFLKSIAIEDKREKEMLDLQNRIDEERKTIEKEQRKKESLKEFEKQKEDAQLEVEKHNSEVKPPKKDSENKKKENTIIDEKHAENKEDAETKNVKVKTDNLGENQKKPENKDVKKKK